MAVEDYFNGTLYDKMDVRALYGDVIGDWCVDHVQDFVKTFWFSDINEPLTNWNTSR